MEVLTTLVWALSINGINLILFLCIISSQLSSYSAVHFRARCKTCDCTYSGSGSKVNDCPGHFGHIELALPVYHVGFIDDVLRILRCVCYHCSRLLVDNRDLKGKRALEIRDPETRLRAIHDLCRGKKSCIPGDPSSLNSVLDGIAVDQQKNESDLLVSSGCAGLLPAYTRKELSIEVNFPEGMEDIPGKTLSVVFILLNR